MKPPRLALWLWVGLVFSSIRVAAGAAGTAPILAEEMLSRAMEARGGREAALQVQSFRAKGRVCFYSEVGPWSFAPITNVWPLEVLAKRPNRFRFITALRATPEASFVFVPSRYYEHGCDGQRAWEALPGNRPQTLAGILGEERCEQAGCFAWCAEPQNYRSMTNRGETMFAGRRCYELLLVSQSGRLETHYYDATNYLLAGVVRSSAFGPSLEQFVFSNYRVFGRFHFPMRIQYQAEDGRPQGRLNAVEEFETIEVNGVAGEAFMMPQEVVRLSQSAAPRSRPVSGAEIKTLLRDWIDGDQLATGAAVGLLDATGARVVAHGRVADWQPGWANALLAKVIGHGWIDQGPKIDGDSVFGIASITKVFTRLLLLDLVQRGKIRLDDPAQHYLPSSIRLPTRNGKVITLLHLATHTSGLPVWVDGNASTLEEIYAAISDVKLSRDPGAGYEYSNIGIDLLGKAIELKAGKSYQQLVVEHICQPLGMSRTSVSRCELPAAGEVYSTVNDMLRFAAACLGLTEGPLSPLMQHEFATHGGDGAGFYASLVTDRVHRRALVMLALAAPGNRFYWYSRQALNRLILDETCKPAVLTPANSRAWDAYAGQYLLDNNSVWSVRRDGRRLLLRETRKPSLELFPESPTGFVNPMFNLRVRFAPGVSNQPMRLTVCELGGSVIRSGNKMTSQVPTAGRPVRLARGVAEEVAGQYQGPGGKFEIIPGEGHHILAVVSQEVSTLVPESDTFFVDPNGLGAVTFLRDDCGKVTGCIRHVDTTHWRYGKPDVQPLKLSEADTDRFLGSWESTVVVTERMSIHAALTISRAKGACQATLSVAEKGIQNHRFKTLVFLTKSSLFLQSSMENKRESFSATLNEAATELSGRWMDGQNAIPVTFKRAAPLTRQSR